ncbi:MAG: galactofuranose transport system permease protein [Thermomicrobiales bacterium]|nr:galactofuranose transport system permease protein [Thermomicrobiales bacterium]
MATGTTDIRGERQSERRAFVGSLLQQQGVLIALLIVLAFGLLRYGENFRSSFNIWEMLRNNSYYGLIALGMTFVIMTGGIDLSVGAVVALTSVTAARLSPHGVLVATLGAIALGLGIGLINGGLIARFKIQPFIVTLAMLLACRGGALNLAHNANVSVDFASGFIDLGQKNLCRIPVPVVITVVAYLLASIVLNLTRFGRHTLAIGGNDEASRLAGLPVARTIVSVYALSGALAGLSGAILAAFAFTGSPNYGIGWELTAIAAVVVGGTLLTGGRGSVWTTLVGVLLLGLIFNELNFERGKGIFELTQYWEEVIRGAFLLIVVIVQSRFTRRGPAALRT